MAPERIAYTLGPDGKVRLSAPDGSVVDLPEAEARERIKQGWNPTERAGAGESFLRGALSSATFGLSEALYHDDAAFDLARSAADARKATAQAAYDAARANGDLAEQLASETALRSAIEQADQIKAQADESLEYERLRSTRMMEDHPIANVAGNIAGMLVPGAPVGKLGSLAGGMASGKIGSTLARFGAEGAAMGIQGGVEEGARRGEYSAGGIATKSLEGAGINALFGVGGLGISAVVNKVWRGGASRLIGESGDKIAENAAAVRRYESDLADLNRIVASDAELGQKFAEVESAYKAGAYRGSDPTALWQKARDIKEGEVALGEKLSSLERESAESIAAKRQEYDAARSAFMQEAASKAASDRALAVEAARKAEEAAARAADPTLNLSPSAQANLAKQKIGLAASFDRQAKKAEKAAEDAVKHHADNATSLVEKAAAARARADEAAEAAGLIKTKAGYIEPTPKVKPSPVSEMEAAPVSSTGGEIDSEFVLPSHLSAARLKEVDEARKKAIAIGLLASGGKVKNGAESLINLSRKEIYSRLKEYGITAKDTAALRSAAGLADGEAVPAAQDVKALIESLMKKHDEIERKYYLAAIESGGGHTTAIMDDLNRRRQSLDKTFKRLDINKREFLNAVAREKTEPGIFAPSDVATSAMPTVDLAAKPVAEAEASAAGKRASEVYKEGDVITSAPKDMPVEREAITELPPLFEKPLEYPDFIPVARRLRAPEQIAREIESTRAALDKIKAARERFAKEEAANFKLADLGESLNAKEWYGDSPVTLWTKLEQSKKAIVSTQAQIQARAARWFSRFSPPMAFGGIGAFMGMRGSDADLTSIVMGGIKGAIAGMIVSKAGDAVATKIAKSAVEKYTSLPGVLAQPITGPSKTISILKALGRATSAETTLRLLPEEEFNSVKRHVEVLSSLAPDIAMESANELIKAGWDPSAARDISKRRAVAIELLADRARANDRVGFSRTLVAVSNPHSWFVDAKSGNLHADTWRVMQRLVPSQAASLSAAAQKILSDTKMARKLPAAQRRMLQMLAGDTQTIGGVQQIAYQPEQQPTSPGGVQVTKKIVPQSTSAEALEQRRGAGLQ